MGAGVVGVTTAYYLLKDGHQVTVIDRQPDAGLETSFANGGQISVSHTESWASPEAPWLMLKWIGRDDAPLLLRLRFDPQLMAWGLKFLANCTHDRAVINLKKNLRLALLSRRLLGELREDTGIVYDHLTRGILQIYRDEDAYQIALRNAAVLHELGSHNHELTAQQCLDLEPALEARRDRLVGGIHTPDDESGDARAFTQNLARICENMGGNFIYDTSIDGLSVEAGAVTGVATSRGEMKANAYVLSLASYGPALVRRIGIKLPIYPTKGYSVTVPTNGHNGAPTVSITDEHNKIVYSRLGDRLRVAGTAEFAGYDTHLNEKRARSILGHARAQFPGAGNFDQAEFWTGLRPMTPDGVPLMGATRLSNLYLNTGHGTLGWTHACGSGRTVADLIGGRNPEVDAADYALTRF